MAAAQTVGSLLLEMLFEDKGVKKGLKDVESSIQSSIKSVDEFAGRLRDRLVLALKATEVGLAAVATGATVVGAQFEQQITKVGSIARESAAGMQLLEDEARRLGETTAFSATQAAEGMENLARSGLKAGDIVAATGAALNFAGANATDMANATEILTSAINAFQYDFERTAEVADVFTVAMQNSLFDVESIREAMKIASPVAKAYGLTLEETVAGVAQFRNLGLVGSKAGNVFRATLSSLVGPTQNAADAIEGMGLTLDEVNPEVVGFETAMRNLAEAGLGSADAIKIFGSEFAGIATAVARSMSTTEDFTDLLGKLEVAAGTTAETYENMTDTLLGRFAIFKSSVEELFLKVYDVIQAPLKAAVEEATRFVNRISSQATTAMRVLGLEGEKGADKVREFGKSINESAEAFIRLLPYIDDFIAALGLAIGALTGVRTALAIFSALPGILAAAKTAMAAFGASTAVATGGLTAIAGAATIAIAALTKLILKFRESAIEAEKLRDAQAGLAAKSEEQKRQEAALTRVLERQKAEIRALFESGEQLDDVRRRELQRILQLDGATARLEITRGRMTLTGGRLITVERLISEFGEDAAEALKSQAKASAESVATFNEVIPKLEEYAEKGEQVGSVHFGLIEANNLLNKTYGFQVGSINELRQKITEMREERDEERTASESLLNTIAKLASERDKEANSIRVEEEALLDLVEQRKAEAEAAAALEAELAKLAETKALLGVLGGEESVDRFSDAFNRAGRVITAEWEDSMKVMEEATDDTFKKLAGLALEGAKTLGDAAMGGIADGIKSAAEGLAGIVSGVISVALGPVGDVVGMITGAADMVLENQAKADELQADAAQLLADADRLAAEGDTEGAEAARQEARSLQDQAATLLEEDGGDFVTSIIDNAILFVETIVDQLPSVIEALLEKLPELFEALVAAIPDLIGMIVAALPELLVVVTDGIALLIGMLPEVVSSILTQLPVIIQTLAEQIPVIIDALLVALPEIIDAIIESIDDIILALVIAVPDIIAAVIAAIPDIVFELVFHLVPGLISAVLQAWPDIFNALLDGVKDIGKAIADAFIQIVSLGFLGGDGEGLNLGDFWSSIGEGIGQLFGADSGIESAPRTMLTRLEPGEAVLDREANMRRLSGRATQTTFAPPSQAAQVGGGGALEVVVQHNDEVLDAVLVEGVNSRRTPRVRRLLKRTSGIRSGVKRGRLQLFTG